MSTSRETAFRIKDPSTGKNFMVPVELVPEKGNKFAVLFDYCPPLQAEIKAMEGARWHGFDKPNPRKVWTVGDTARNRFRMRVLEWAGRKADGSPVVPGQVDPFERWSRPLIPVDCPPRFYNGVLTKPYEHQPHGVSVMITRRQAVLGWDMGVGKTLTVIYAMEWAKDHLGWEDSDFWFVCKAGALLQIVADFREWGSRVKPRITSYETLTSTIASWQPGKPAPKFVVYDESTQIKMATAQRSIAALHLADSMRAEHEKRFFGAPIGPATPADSQEPFIICMTGTPSPKNPVDWWHQVEVVRPGFIKEGDPNKFKKSLAIIETVEREDGGAYPKIISWLDDERKCGKCGKFSEAADHGDAAINMGRGHYYQKSVNEVQRIFTRLKGLVDIKLKKDCLDLPQKVKKIIKCEPSREVLNAAKLVAKAARGAAHALVLMRELSDGFQYQDIQMDTKGCGTCGGSGTMLHKFDPEEPDSPVSDAAIAAGRLEERLGDCDVCEGAGEVPVIKRQTVRVGCPKDDVLEDIIDDHEDVGRLVVYAGFTGSVDRVVDIFVKLKWSVIRVDGRGWHTFGGLPLNGKEAYHAFRYKPDDYPKVAFVAQASTAGHGLNFDCCPTEVFYSNDFHWENRVQAGERNQRGKIAETLKKHKRQHTLEIDIVHLPSDQFVLDNHEKKRKLQSLTMGEVQAALEK